MSQFNIAGIVGIDGNAPSYNENEVWRIWSKDDIYWGDATPGLNKHVPKINDYIKDLATNIDYRVIDLDPTTMVPTYVKVKSASTDGQLTNEDILLGPGPGTQSDTYRCYIDTRTMPAEVAIDRRCKINGTDVKYAKLYRGTSLESSQKVISMFFDTAGNLLGNKIPMELVLFNNADINNIAVKIPKNCFTTENIPDGETLTIVFFGESDIVLSKRQLIAENTAFISASSDSEKYVVGIGLVSPWLSSSDSSLLLVPENVLTDGMNLMGEVRYSDGSRLELPVDNSKFSLGGLDDYVASQSGQMIPLMLNYFLSPNEVSYTAEVGERRHIPKPMRILTEDVKGAYSVKLFCYPVWIDAISGYRLEWWMANLDRSGMFLATPYVRINTDVAVFNPTLYGTMQRLSVTVNLKEVQVNLVDWNHTQVVEVTLIAPGTDRGPNGNWVVGFDPAQSPPYGAQNAAISTFINQNSWKLKIDQNEQSQAAWIERMYYRARPLFAPSRESAAPLPTHFVIVFNDQSIEFPIAEWNIEHALTHSLVNSGTLFVKFIKRMVDTDLELAMIGIPIHQSN